MPKLKIFISFLSLLFSFSIFAEKIDSNYIENLAKTFLEKQIVKPSTGNRKIEITPIDPRVVIRPCDQPLTLNIPVKTNNRNVNVKVSCENSTPWKLYLPAKISITIPIVIAKNYISKGSILDDSNITIIEKDSFKIRGEYFSDIKSLLNNKALTSIAKGRTIAKNNICLVCKGGSVIIEAGDKNFAIQTDGIALSNGTLGQIIRVENKHSKRTLSAQIINSNHVKINL